VHVLAKSLLITLDVTSSQSLLLVDQLYGLLFNTKVEIHSSEKSMNFDITSQDNNTGTPHSDRRGNYKSVHPRQLGVLAVKLAHNVCNDGLYQIPVISGGTENKARNGQTEL
jgi:hypothetical protein